MENVTLEVTLKMHMDMDKLLVSEEDEINPVELLKTGQIGIDDTRIVMKDPDGEIVMDKLISPEELDEIIIEVFGEA